MPNPSSMPARAKWLPPAPAPAATGRIRSEDGEELLLEPVLLWSLAGCAEVAVDGVRATLPAGEALWLPRGAALAARLAPSDVVVPVPGLVLDGASGSVRVPVRSALRPWLLRAYADALGYLDAGPAAPIAQRLLGAAADGAALLPPMPSDPQLLAAAHRLRRDPACFESVAREAAAIGWSPRTLQRRFLAETGYGVLAWVRAARIAAAAEALAEGRDLAWVAHRVGYASVSGFARQFRAATGESPGRWRHRTASPVATVAAADEPAPALPAERTWQRVNGGHVAVWVAEGEALLRIGGGEHRLLRGQAAVLPAGLVNSVVTAEGALLLPLGYRSGATGAVGELLEPAVFDAGEHDRLVQSAVAAYTPLRGAPQPDGWAFDAVLGRSRRRPVTAEDDLLAGLASAAALHPLRSLQEHAEALGADETRLARTVREGTGLGLAQWSRLARMSRARAQLQLGAAAGAVARGLGYAHLPAFTRAFRAVHGASPSSVQRRR